MKNLKSSKGTACKITVYLLLILTAALTACTNADQNTDASSDTNNESKHAIHKDEEFTKLEDKFNTQIGVYAIDTGKDQTVEYHSEKRFAYSSTFKVLAAAGVLKQNDIKDLEKVVSYTKNDLVDHSPVTEKHVDTGMSLLEISEAAIRKSDNTAGNLLLEAIGGPEEFKQTLRNMGDNVTQPDRYEVELNEYSPKNKRDTSTPKMMTTNLRKVTLGDFLPDDKRKLLIDWMKGNEAGDPLIREGAPKGWEVADKSGAGTYGTRNDIAVVYPPNREPIVIAVMSRQDEENAEFEDSVIANAAKITLDALK